MVSLVLATLFFVGIHIVISGTPLRRRLTGRMGEQAYRGLFSILSIGGIVWMAWSYNEAPMIPLWGRVEGLVAAAAALVFIGFLIGVPGLLMRSPTAVGGEEMAAPQARGMLRITRHPFLWGVTLWALGHLIANGDVASLIFFFGFFVLALVGQTQIDAKRQRRLGEKWRSFEAVTSRVPYAAIIAGRNTLVLSEIGWWRVLVALIVFLVLVWLHPLLFGVTPYPIH